MKLLSFDLDGTLMPVGTKEIPLKTINKLKEIVENGNIIIFNSGRPYDALKKYVSRVQGDNVFLGICNGASILDCNGNILFEKGVPNEYLKEESLANPDFAVYSYTTDNKIMYYRESHFIDYEAKVNGQNKFKLEYDKPYDESVSLKLLFSSDENIMNNVPIIYDKNKYSLVKTKSTMSELMDKSVDKESAIKVIKDMFNIDDCNIYAFGDADNDYLSIKKYNGATFDGGSDLCKAGSKYISDKSESEWVLDALRFFGI